MKKTNPFFLCNLLFLISILLVLLACAINIGIAYYNIAHTPYTSAPAWVAFVLIVPYGLGALGLGIIWLITWLCLKRKQNKEKV